MPAKAIADEGSSEPAPATLATLERLWQRVRHSSESVPPRVDLRELEMSSLRLGMFFAEVFDHFGLDVGPLRTVFDSIGYALEDRVVLDLLLVMPQSSDA